MNDAKRKPPVLRVFLVCCVLVAMAVWLYTGYRGKGQPAPGPGQPPAVAADPQAEKTLVRGVRSQAAPQQIYLNVHGQTSANRVVQIKSEISGTIKALPGAQGVRVKQGDLLCRIGISTRGSDYAQAQAKVESAQLEYDGIADLFQRGLQSDVVLARAKATLEERKFAAHRAQRALQKTTIKAPFDGLVTSQFAEVGDYLTPGDPCVTLMEIDPMLITGQIAEKRVGQLALGGAVLAQLITGSRHQGQITYIGHAPDAATRTYPIEVTVANPEAAIRVGLTAEMRVPLGLEEAHLISPASLLLDDLGSVGVHLVDGAGRVRFMPVQVVDESPAGLLVKGLPKDITLIVVGHEEVAEGELVQVDYTPLAKLVRF